MSLRGIADDYIARFRENANYELRYFRSQKTLGGAIRLATLSRTPTVKWTQFWGPEC